MKACLLAFWRVLFLAFVPVGVAGFSLVGQPLLWSRPIRLSTIFGLHGCAILSLPLVCRAMDLSLSFWKAPPTLLHCNRISFLWRLKDGGDTNDDGVNNWAKDKNTCEHWRRISLLVRANALCLFLTTTNTVLEWYYVGCTRSLSFGWLSFLFSTVVWWVDHHRLFLRFVYFS